MLRVGFIWDMPVLKIGRVVQYFFFAQWCAPLRDLSRNTAGPFPPAVLRRRLFSHQRDIIGEDSFDQILHFYSTFHRIGCIGSAGAGERGAGPGRRRGPRRKAAPGLRMQPRPHRRTKLRRSRNEPIFISKVPCSTAPLHQVQARKTGGAEISG